MEAEGAEAAKTNGRLCVLCSLCFQKLRQAKSGRKWGASPPESLYLRRRSSATPARATARPTSSKPGLPFVVAGVLVACWPSIWKLPVMPLDLWGRHQYVPLPAPDVNLSVCVSPSALTYSEHLLSYESQKLCAVASAPPVLWIVTVICVFAGTVSVGLWSVAPWSVKKYAPPVACVSRSKEVLAVCAWTGATARKSPATMTTNPKDRMVPRGALGSDGI